MIRAHLDDDDANDTISGLGRAGGLYRQTTKDGLDRSIGASVVDLDVIMTCFPVDCHIKVYDATQRSVGRGPER